MGFLRNKWLTRVARLVLGGFFIYASYHKVVDPPDFAKSIYNYKIVPGELIHFSALFLAWLELIAGIAVLTGMGLRGGAALLGCLCVVFIVALSYNLTRCHPTACGCFATYEESLTKTDGEKYFEMWREIFLNAGLLLLVLQALWATRAKFAGGDSEDLAIGGVG